MLKLRKKPKLTSVAIEAYPKGFGGVIPQNGEVNDRKEVQVKEEKVEVPETAAKVIALAPAADETLNLTGRMTRFLANCRMQDRRYKP